MDLAHNAVQASHYTQQVNIKKEIYTLLTTVGKESKDGRVTNALQERGHYDEGKI